MSSTSNAFGLGKCAQPFDRPRSGNESFAHLNLPRPHLVFQMRDGNSWASAKSAVGKPALSRI
jgi:hypothetical protein